MDECVCARCHRDYCLDEGCEPSKYCNRCVHDVVDELEARLATLNKPDASAVGPAMSTLTVGKLREQSALSPADRRVVLVTSDESLMGILGELELVKCYPDTTDEHGNWTGAFKIEARRKKGP